MPKVKTRKTVSKRFKVTAGGKILRGHQYSRHRRSHKSKRLRRSYHLAKKLTVQQTKRIKKMLNI